MKHKIKKSELRKLVKEHLSSFTPGVAPLGAMGNATLQDSLDKAAGVEVNKEEFDAILSKVVSQIEKNASIRMTAESAGVKDKSALKEISGDEEEKDAADDVMEAALRKNKKVRVDSSGDEYDGKVGVIHKVGTGKQKGAYVVKMPDGSLNSYNEDELVMEAKLVPEGKKAKLTDKVLDDPSTIKLMNPSNRKETFVIFSRNIKGMRGKQDKFSMVTIDKRGMVIDDYGSHPMEKGAMKFAMSRGFTKQTK